MGRCLRSIRWECLLGNLWPILSLLSANIFKILYRWHRNWHCICCNRVGFWILRCRCSNNRFHYRLRLRAYLPNMNWRQGLIIILNNRFLKIYRSYLVSGCSLKISKKKSDNNKEDHQNQDIYSLSLQNNLLFLFNKILRVNNHPWIDSEWEQDQDRLPNHLSNYSTRTYMV